MSEQIIVKGAREHNLRNIHLALPKNALICFTGVSGSGKSSLAFDTLFAEGHRRYLESLSTFARQFIGQLTKPDVDVIQGLSPAISISQKSTGSNPRSTVGTLTEIYDYLRLLYARVGLVHCPVCLHPVKAQTRDEIVHRLSSHPHGTRLIMMAPVVRHQKGAHRELFRDLQRQGFLRARVDGSWRLLSQGTSLDPKARHDIDVVIDEWVWDGHESSRLSAAVEKALTVGQGVLICRKITADGTDEQAEESIFSQENSCPRCGISFPPLEPNHFSFNSIRGMCLLCRGATKAELFQFEQLIRPNDSLLRACSRISDDVTSSRYVFDRIMELGSSLGARTQKGSFYYAHEPWSELSPAEREYLLFGSAVDPVHDAASGGTHAGMVRLLTDLVINGSHRFNTKYLKQYIVEQTCPVCQGTRLNALARNVRLTTAHPQLKRSSLTLPEVCQLTIREAAAFMEQLVLEGHQRRIAEDVLKEIRARLGFLVDVGLEYLTLDREAPSLSGGEAQRIRLASQIGSGLTGVLYVLDEPSIGLHARDNRRLISALQRLRDLGNTVVVVEHDEETMRSADWVVDFGPGAGRRGGHVVAAGTVADVCRQEESVTGAYLARRRQIPVPPQRRSGNGKVLRVVGARHNNLKNITVEFPLATFICVTGVSGSGKSSLVNDILIEALNEQLNGGNANPGQFERLEGVEHLDKMIAIDQSPIGRTPRSNPGTYVKVFDDIRKFYAELPEARRRGFSPGRFSFNVDGGRCSACEGNGATLLEMDFLADVWLTCPVCQGKRFNRETLQVRYKDYSVADVLEMEVDAAAELFENFPGIRKKLATLQAIGLDYIQLGQPSPTLSGGEAQRIKLARELSKHSTGRTMYLLDEPTTGLHFADVELLLHALQRLVDAGNTVVVVEHHLDVIKVADWIIDLGPEGGQAGGYVVTCGTPEQVAQCRESYTGRALREVLRLDDAHHEPLPCVSPPTPATAKRDESNDELRVHGASEHNLQHVELSIPRHAMTVFCGPSGSGKTSLAIDTIYAEGQRRYVESLSTYARQYVSQMPKPQVEHVWGLSPAIAIEQKRLAHNPRSTVGTVTEIYDCLRVLFARLGTPYCPACRVPVGTQTADQIVDQILTLPEGTRMLVLAPLKTDSTTDFEAMWSELRAEGFVRVRVDGTTYPIESVPKMDRRAEHTVEVVVDRYQVSASDRSRLTESVEAALNLAEGYVRIAIARDNWPEPRWPQVMHSVHLACRSCGRSFERLQPSHFSFNSRLGWCPTCEGLGMYTGCNPDSFVTDPSLSLAEGALPLWPDIGHPWARAMLEALCQGTGLPAHVPYEKLTVEHRRLLWFGTGEQWFEVKLEPDTGAPVRFSFQYHGLQAALENAAKRDRRVAERLQEENKERLCLACCGSRLREDAAAVRFAGRTIHELCQWSLGHLAEEVASWKLDDAHQRVGQDLLQEIRNRLQFLLDVGLEYLTLDRPAASLSSGEAQRIRLARQLGSGLCGVLYVLDEPTVGLHPRDTRRLISALHKLRDLGNTLVVVEHDREVIAAGDMVVDFGPGAGHQGGRVVAQAPPDRLAAEPGSVTGPYLSGREVVTVPTHGRLKVVGPTRLGERAVLPLSDVERVGRPGPCPRLVVRGARHHNLKNVTVEFPLHVMVAVTGPSGSGKSTLVHDILYHALARKLHHSFGTPGTFDSLDVEGSLAKVVLVDQRPISSTPHSTPATYCGVFTPIRELFARQPTAIRHCLHANDFSFNTGRGRCSVCSGQGQRRIEMHFLPDVWVPCSVCQGKRYGGLVLQVTFRGKTISDVLEMTCAEARDFFADESTIRARLDVLCDVGLGYLKLGQPASTLSGGESQRLKLAAELGTPSQQHALYLLDEPTTGLHFRDIQLLLDVLRRLVDDGHSVVIIEHNLDVIKACDWIIDLGPEAGERGGYVVAAGTPQHLVQWAERAATGNSGPRCITGEFLAEVLGSGPSANQDHKAACPPDTGVGKPPSTDTVRPAHDSLLAGELPDEWRRALLERLSRPSTQPRWDTELLSSLLCKVQQTGLFSPPQWEEPGTMVIYGKGRADWFLRAIIDDPQCLKLMFNGAGERKLQPRQATNRRSAPHQTVSAQSQPTRIDTGLCVEAADATSPSFVVGLKTTEDLDTERFKRLFSAAVGAYQKANDNAAAQLYMDQEHVPPGASSSPWQVMQKTWHISRNGFPADVPPQWPQALVREVLDDLEKLLPTEHWDWSNPHRVVMVWPDETVRICLWTKLPNALRLEFAGLPPQFVPVVHSLNFNELTVLDDDQHTIRYEFSRPEDWRRFKLLLSALIMRCQRPRDARN